MRRRSARYSFFAKMAFVVPLMAAADALFHDEVGSWLGGVMLAWTVALAAARPALRRGPALVAGGAASAFALAAAGSPGLLGWTMFWIAISIAALLPRADGFDDAWRWAVRVTAHGVTGLFTPLIDLLRLFRPRPQRGRMTARMVAAMLALPLAMGVIFVALFASAKVTIIRPAQRPPVARVLGYLRSRSKEFTHLCPTSRRSQKPRYHPTPCIPRLLRQLRRRIRCRRMPSPQVTRP